MKNVPRPEGQRDDYLFVSDGEQTFKALHELRTSDRSQPVLVISLAPVDDQGKAIKLQNGEADVVWHSHTFTEVELASPDFDISGRIAAILADLAQRKRREMAAREQIGALGDAWRAGTINLTTTTEKEA
ncbi:MAG: hypothetical protein ACK4IS_07370 [Erythrobacter sp.]